ncbi:sensor domain-containing diguanylate cyclase [Vibrio atypicus]|uniref:sensor domain-containing diguanylate cyclase n=1 Tax=Vibrio atypicus TaxID=558271 RepID=UPI00135787A2|nr:diguanylate cyclase [Vibrio atypicus]
MKYRQTLLLFLILVSCAFGLTAYFVSKQIIENVVEDLTWKYSQVAAQYDVERTLAPILEEVALVEQLAQHPHILSWAHQNDDPVYRSAALETLEHYRWLFRSKNFFIVLDGDLSYHYNDVPSVRSPSFLRYYLEPDSATDTWYFEQRNKKQDLSVNIAKDVHIDRTKVWVNQAIMDRGEFLGVVGTGLDITLFTNQLAHKHASSLRTFFVDAKSNVQLILDNGKFQYPLRTADFKKPNLSTYIPNRHELNVLSQLMRQQKDGEEAELLMIEQEEGRAVVSIHYIDELGWYELTFVNVDSMLPPWAYSNLSYFFIALSLTFGVMAYLYCLRVWVNPIESWALRIRSLANESEFYREGKGTHLGQYVDVLETELSQSRHSIQKMVVSRTAILDELTTVDVVTQLWNKKGLDQELDLELARAEREQIRFGLLWIDLGVMDQLGFDSCNETYDHLLFTAAQGIEKAVRVYDRAARWEDDEFLVLVRASYPCNLEQLAKRITACIAEQQKDVGQVNSSLASLAIGGVIIEPGTSKAEALALADRALYTAKQKSENSIYIYHSKKAVDQIA